MRTRLLKNVLSKRNESSSAGSGFKAGLIVGFLNAIYTLVTTLLYKEETINGLEKTLSNYTEAVNVETIYYITLAVLPIIIILLFTIIGIVIGVVMNRLKHINRSFVLLGGAVMGLLFGLSLNAPSPDLNVLNIILGVISGLLFAIFYLLFNTQKR